MLTIDMGNTSLNWAVWENNHVTLSNEGIHHSTFDGDTFRNIFLTLPAIDKIWVANVAGTRAAEQLEKYLTSDWSSSHKIAELVFFKTQKKCCGVTNAYDDPSQYGVDRWAGLIAARSLCDTGVCVIDLGTAVTVDMMNDAGLHEGGMIMPGLTMMQQSLIKNTSDISFDASEFSSHQAFANTTQAAVQSGTLNLLRAGLEDVCLQAIKRYGEKVTIFITGGLATKILPLLSLRQIIHEPQLVLTGLHIAAND